MATPVLQRITGFWRSLRGDDVALAIANQLMNYQSGLVGSATASAAGGTKCALGINQFDTVGASSTATLPPYQLGAKCVVINNTATNALTIYPYESTTTINALSAGSTFSLATGKTIEFYCGKAGKWFGNLSA